MLESKRLVSFLPCIAKLSLEELGSLFEGEIRGFGLGVLRSCSQVSGRRAVLSEKAANFLRAANRGSKSVPQDALLNPGHKWSQGRYTRTLLSC